jgi:hypothetical protein
MSSIQIDVLQRQFDDRWQIKTAERPSRPEHLYSRGSGRNAQAANAVPGHVGKELRGYLVSGTSTTSSLLMSGS